MTFQEIESDNLMSILAGRGREFPFYPPDPETFPNVLQMICTLSNTILQATQERLEESLQAGLGAIGQFFGVDSAYLYLYSDSGDRVEQTFEWNASGPHTQKGRVSGMRLCPFAYTMQMVRDRMPMVLRSIEELPERARPERLFWTFMGTKSLLGNPLYLQGSLLGYFGLSSRLRSRNWTREEVELSRLLAGLFANSLSRFRSEKRLREAKESELSIAAEIQRSLLSPALIPGSFPVNVGISSHPSLSVDGDFIDLFQNPDGSIDLIMGDSMGKGVPAALLSAATKIAILRARAEGCELNRKGSPGEILRKVQEEMGEKLAEMSAFVTLAFARYYPDRRTLQILNAGHTTILIWRQFRGVVESFDSRNPPIGLLSPTEIKFEETSVKSGDVMLIYSDGLTDSRNPEGKFFGVKRAKEILQNTHYLPAQEIADRFYRLCMVFTGKNHFHDDFSCLVVSIP